MLGFKGFRNAAITIAGIELLHRIRKGQFALGRLAFKAELRLQSGTRCFRPEVCTAKQGAFACAGYLHQSHLGHVARASVKELLTGPALTGEGGSARAGCFTFPGSQRAVVVSCSPRSQLGTLHGRRSHHLPRRTQPITSAMNNASMALCPTAAAKNPDCVAPVGRLTVEYQASNPGISFRRVLSAIRSASSLGTASMLKRKQSRGSGLS